MRSTARVHVHAYVRWVIGQNFCPAKIFGCTVSQCNTSTCNNNVHVHVCIIEIKG